MKLQQKILLLFVSIAVLIGGPSLWTVRQATRQIDLQEVEERGEQKATDIAELAAHGFMAAQENILLPLLQRAQEQAGALYVAAIESNGRVLAHTNVAEKDQIYTDGDTLAELLLTTPYSQSTVYQNAPVVEVIAPVWSGPDSSAEDFLLSGEKGHSQKKRLGMIRLALPIGEVMQREMRLLRRITMILFIAGGIGVLLLFAVMRRVLRPIEWLSKGTARIAQGDYGSTVPVISKDELGALANDFNRMSLVLSETTVSKDFLGSILSNMIDPLIVMSIEGIIQMVNQATLDLLGYERSDLEGKSAHVLFMPAEKASKITDQETLIMKGLVRNLELELFHKSGQKLSVLFSSSVLKDGKDNPTGIVAVAKDMTERKRLESIIRQSDKMSAVGQLAAGVAHEINNPLGVILGFAQAVLRRIKPGEMLEMPLKSIEKEAVRCKNLVQDLLTFSRVSKIEREPLDLNMTIQGALSLVNAQAKISRVEVRQNLATGLPRFMGNSNQIQQVIVNLANNAFDAMADHGVLTVETEIILEGALSWIRLKIADTGPGIPPEIIHRIFEPFFTTKPVGKGTGLGLSLIHEIVKKHSGMIDVKSRPGCTEFEIKFPVRLLHAIVSKESAGEAPQL